MTTSITYEFPLNERIRVFIRIEQLFIQLQHFLVETTISDTRAAIKTLMDLLVIFSRNDIKSEIIKEIDRHIKAFSLMSDMQGVDVAKLKSILNDLDQMSKRLYAANGKLGASVMQSDLFQSISQRSAIPGGTCSFDLPGFHYWLEQDGAVLRHDLEQWIRPFNDIRQAIDLLLNFIRKSGRATEEIAQAGFFQLALDSSQLYQLLLIKLDRNLPYFAETSGGKHRFTIRIMSPSAEGGRPGQTQENVPFTLTCCSF
ncbi:MAG: cell division protein ZapD [Methylococcaceae bacterium]|nr:cell division protein ZapD [Methylococcaceae bacterium]